MIFYEQTVLGGVLNGTIKPDELALSSSDFEDADLGQLLLLARKLYSEDQEITIDTVYVEFAEKDGGWLTKADLQAYCEKAHSLAAVTHAIEKIQGRSLKTVLTKKIEDLLSSNGHLSGGQLLDQLRAAVKDNENIYKSLVSNFEFIAEFADEQQKLYEELHEGKVVAVPTGFIDWDERLLDGFSKGDEHIIVGLTGSGKSALALNCALHQAKHGYTVGVVSREMARAENMMRIQSADSKIPRWKIKRYLNKDVLTGLSANLTELKNLRLAFDTKTSDIETLSMQTRLMAETSGLDILYVDYLQLMKSNATHSSRANEVQSISRGLKELAMELHIPVVSLCQFNRGVVNAPITEVMNHLKESSGIEQDASTISVIQIEKSELETNRFDPAKLIVIKNRNGATFKPVDLTYAGDIFTFYPVVNEVS